MVVGGIDDEIQQYIDAWYVGPTEAAWRFYGFKIHEETSSVTRLSLHLEGMHLCVFNPNTPKAVILARAKNQKSTLTAFFKYCGKNPNARCYTYQEFLEHFVWDIDGKKKWTPRKTKAFSIGRMYFANPNSGERFYLRLLLTVVPGPISFESLYWYENKKYDTYKDACIARGLLEDYNELEKCLEESAKMKTGYQLRKLFLLMLTECNPTSPDVLRGKHCLDICDDCHTD